MCRSRRELSNEYLLAKIGVDTAENEPLEVWGKIQFIIHSPLQGHKDSVSALLGAGVDKNAAAGRRRYAIDHGGAEWSRVRTEVNKFE